MSSRSRWCARIIFLSFVGLMATLSVVSVRAQDAYAHNLPKRIVADYGYWSKYQTPRYSHTEIPYYQLTHINHAGVGFNADGSLSVPPGFLEPGLNNRAHMAGVKVLLLLGGDFTGLETSGKLQTLVDNIAAFEKQYDYDGVDMDWEYPETTADRVLLVKLMARLRKSNPNYVLSIDAPPWQRIRIRLEGPDALAGLLQHHDVRLRRSVDGVRPAQFADLSGTSTIRRRGNA